MGSKTSHSRCTSGKCREADAKSAHVIERKQMGWGRDTLRFKRHHFSMSKQLIGIEAWHREDQVFLGIGVSTLGIGMRQRRCI